MVASKSGKEINKMIIPIVISSASLEHQKAGLSMHLSEITIFQNVDTKKDMNVELRTTQQLETTRT